MFVENFKTQLTMKSIFLIIILSFSLIPKLYSQADSLSQKPKRLNAVYFGREWFGTINSINYDRILISRGVSSIAVRVGFSAAKEKFNNRGWAYIFPGELNLLLGKNTHYFEMGLSCKYLFADFREGDKKRKAHTWRVGYRIKSSKIGLITRIGLSPGFFGNTFIPIIDGSVGWSF